MATTRPTRRSSARFVERRRATEPRTPANRSGTEVAWASLRGCATAILALASAGGWPIAEAQTWRLVPAFSLESTFTDNVDLSPSDQRKSDWVNQFTPAITLNEVGARTRISGTLSVPILLYARTSENNYVAPEVRVNATYEGIEKFFFVDASANVSQQYVSPFGARSTSLANATQNRYTAQSYTVSPYIQGEAPNDIRYQLRQQNYWSNATGVSSGASNNDTYTSTINGYVARDPRPFGWSLDYNRSDHRFTDVSATNNWERTQIARVSGVYRADATLQLKAILGYEDNHFVNTTEKGATYGAGIVWQPTDRTNLDATLEHRFFGASYHVDFSHRTPLTVWSLNATRDITDYPQLVANLPAGANVNVLLDSLYSTRVPDAAQRQAFVDQLIRERGLPAQLSGAVPIYVQNVTLVESFTATFGILGARNSIFFTAFHFRDEPVVPSEPTLVPLLDLVNNTTQTGLNAAWTHQLEPSLTLITSAGVSRATQNTGEGGSSRLYSLDARLSRLLSPLTTAYAGARYQHSVADASVGFGYTEFAVFVGFTHTFH